MMVFPRWSGETVVCIATGPSLTVEDVNACRGRSRVIAINDAHRLAPWADVLYSSDRRWWEFYKGVPGFAGMKYGIGSAPSKKNGFPPSLGIRVLRNTGYHGLELAHDGLRNGKNSGYAAINLAVHFGATRILLLGYNMAHHGNKAHFFGSHPSGLNQNVNLYPSFLKAFDSIVEPLKAAGVEVINCSRESALNAFPRMLLEQSLPPMAQAGAA